MKSAAERQRAFYLRRRLIVNGLKAQPCVDCGVQYPPCVMDFDHVRGEKKFNIGKACGRASHTSVLEEIDKCDVVCANCHRLRTHVRRASQARP